MRQLILSVTAALMLANMPAYSAVVSFLTDPFAGSTALTTPGRQVVGGEPSITFDVGTDLFAFDQSVFGINRILFANNTAGNLPTTGVNVVVLESFDDDANATTPYGAGNAANLIADRITAPGAGFFIYFNSGLNLPRLVFSTDLNDNTADLKILARMTNFTGNTASLATFAASNFTTVPEPSAFLLIASTGVLWAFAATVRRRIHR